jgi:hypothetical protein
MPTAAVEARVQSQSSLCGGLWYTKWHWAGFLRVLQSFLSNLHFTNAQYSYITAPDCVITLRTFHVSINVLGICFLYSIHYGKT